MKLSTILPQNGYVACAADTMTHATTGGWWPAYAPMIALHNCHKSAVWVAGLRREWYTGARPDTFFEVAVTSDKRAYTTGTGRLPHDLVTQPLPY